MGMLSRMKRDLELLRGISHRQTKKQKDLDATGPRFALRDRPLSLIYGQQGTVFNTSVKKKKWQKGYSNYEKPRLFRHWLWTVGTYVNPARDVKRVENWKAVKKAKKKVRV